MTPHPLFVRRLGGLLLALVLAGCSSIAHKAQLGPAAPGQAKTIAVFFDGTHNDETSDTNVKRLHALATLRRPDPQAPLAALYVEGVGVGGDVLGMGTGLGIQGRVRLGYEFLLQQYRPGDQVFLVGFSRGAYAARILASLLHNAGLPPVAAQQGQGTGRSAPGDTAALSEAVFAAVKRRLPRQPGAGHRAFDPSASPAQGPWFHAIAAGACPQTQLQVAAGADGHWALRRALTHCSLEQAGWQGGPSVPVQALVLWDTVEALGLPNYPHLVRDKLKIAPVPINIDLPNDRYGDQLCNVRHAYQALSLDDNRERIFTPLPLSRRHLFEDCGGQAPMLGPAPPAPPAPPSPPTRAVGAGVPLDQSAQVAQPVHGTLATQAIALSPLTGEPALQEVWFSGAHSDVGGGYADNGLSGLSLNWMLGRLKAHRLVGAEAGVPADAFGPSHNPEDGWASVAYHHQHRNLAAYALDAEQLPAAWGRVCVHPSVLERRRLLPLRAHENPYLRLRQAGEVCLQTVVDPWYGQTDRLQESGTPSCATERRLRVAVWPDCPAVRGGSAP